MGAVADHKGAASAAPAATAQYDTGIEIEYFVKPKRQYKIRKSGGYDGAGARDEGESGPQLDDPSSAPEWVEVPSVTTVLECLDKPALPWWGMKVGAKGVAHLFNIGLVFPVEVPANGLMHNVLGHHRIVEIEKEGKKKLIQTSERVVADEESLVQLLNMHQLTTNHVKRAAGDRGQSCHDALEIWAKTGDLPDPAMFPPAEQGYVMALLRFLQDLDPEPIESEVMVGSYEHGFAGRYDLRLLVKEERRVVTHHTPVKGPQYTVVPPGIHLNDLKTSKGVYFTHPKQLAAYELGSVECGMEASSARAVIHCEADGRYRYVPCHQWATPDDFLTTLAEYKSQVAMKKRKPAGGS